MPQHKKRQKKKHVDSEPINFENQGKFADLSTEVQLQIFNWLDTKSLGKLTQCSKHFNHFYNDVLKNNLAWRKKILELGSFDSLLNQLQQTVNNLDAGYIIKLETLYKNLLKLTSMEKSELDLSDLICLTGDSNLFKLINFDEIGDSIRKYICLSGNIDYIEQLFKRDHQNSTDRENIFSQKYDENISLALYYLIRSGNIELLNKMLVQYPQLTTEITDANYIAILCAAAESGSPNMFDHFWKKNIHLPIPQKFILITGAAACGQLAMLKHLVESKEISFDDFDHEDIFELLQHVIASGNIDAFKYVMSKQQTNLLAEADLKHLLLVAFNESLSLPMIKHVYGFIKNLGFNSNDFLTYECLKVAATTNSFSLVKFILEQATDPAILTTIIKKDDAVSADEDENEDENNIVEVRNIFHEIAENSTAEMMQYVYTALKNKLYNEETFLDTIDPKDLVSNDDTILHIAVENNNPDIIIFAVETLKIDVNALTIEGDTALDIAINDLNLNCIICLLAFGGTFATESFAELLKAYLTTAKPDTLDIVKYLIVQAPHLIPTRAEIDTIIERYTDSNNEKAKENLIRLLDELIVINKTLPRP